MNHNALEIRTVGAASIPYIYMDKKGNEQSLSMPVIDEHEFTVHIPGEPSLHFLCIPQNLRELIIGHLISEGRIASLSELLAYSFNEDLSSAEVRLSSPASSIVPLKKLPKADIDLSAVFSALKRLHQGFDNYNVTKSTHSCQLWVNGKPLHVFEDMGRHNAVDKAIGYVALQGIDPQKCFLFTSCRLPSDIIYKTIRSRIPVLASKALPTKHAVEVARQYGLRILCCTEPDSLCFFS